MTSAKDTDKTTEQFPGELEKLRRRMAELEASELKHRQTEAELMRRNQQLLTIQAAVAAINSSLELETVLNAVAREMLNLLRATGCIIYENNALAGTITIIFETGPETWQDVPYVGHIFQLADFPLTHQILDERQARQMTLDRPDIDPAELAYMQEYNFKTLLMLPMIFQERLVGLLEIVDEQTVHRFEDREIALAQLLANQAASAIENSRLYAKTRRQLQEQTALREASAIIFSTLDLKTVLTHLAEQMSRAVDATSAYFSKYEPETLSIAVLAEYYSPQANLQEQVSDLNTTYCLVHDFPDTLTFLEARQPQVTHLDDPDLDEKGRAHMEQFGAQSVLSIPLQLGDQILGFADLWESRRHREFTPEEIRLSQDIARQGAIAIQNAQWYAAEQKARRVAETLQAANQALTQSLDLDTVLETLLTYVGQLVPYDSANVMLVKADTQIVIRAIRGYEAWTDPEQFRQITFDARTTPSIQTVLTNRESVLIPNTYEYSSWQPRSGTEYIRNWLGVPLVVGDQVIGLYSMDKAQPEYFTLKHCNLAEALAPQAAIAVQNAQLFAAAQRRLNELTLLVDSSKAVSVALDVETALKIIARQVTKAMATKECAISIWDKEQDKIVTLLDYVVEKERAEAPGTAYALKDYPATRRVLTKNQPMLIQLNDPAADPVELTLLKQWGFSSMLMVPLVVRDQVIGLLELSSVIERTYTDTEIGLCQTLANQMAAALENTRLLEQVQCYANKLEQRVTARTAELTRTNAELQTEIIERQQAEKKLTIARDQALAASRFKTELMAKVSHELRTPLSAILGLTELLMIGAYGPISDQQKEATVKILDSTHYLTKLVNELLSQAKLDTGHFSLKQEMFAPAPMLEQVRSKMNVLAQNKGLQLITDLALDMPSLICGDPDQVQQILANLVSNAIKFTQQGTVTISLYCPDPLHWALQVTDTGPGIPADAHAYIFEPFRQVDGSMTRQHGGTGLGLSIVKQLTELMDGQITLTSEIGQGSTFTVILPLNLTPGKS